jgi:hypothetical protein
MHLGLLNRSMTMPFPTYSLGLFVGLLPGVIVALLISRRLKDDIGLLRECLVAEEASKRHFMVLSAKQEATIALMHQEQMRLKVENTLLRSRAPSVSGVAA